MNIKGHDWHWFGKDTGGKCEKWRAHDPKECKGAAAHTPGKRAPDDRKKKSLSVTKKRMVAKAYVARLEQRSAKDDVTDNDSE